MKYTFKCVAKFDFVDVDTFSAFILCDMVEKLEDDGVIIENVLVAAAEVEDHGDATKEEVDVSTTEEEVVHVEEESEDVEEFYVSDHEYDWGGDEECKQEEAK
ncbi:hypothetical protein V6N11_059015 [Hibiscus sabdariffa]|uniref:Uncharacterized protein n=1 Tax=Hibiscus sabdariffa TaxID=183260 RepID=A0ABR2U6J4_9ROSI